MELGEKHAFDTGNPVERRKLWEPNRELYALVLPCDQTMVYLTGRAKEETTQHPRAKLWETADAAHAFMRSVGYTLDQVSLEIIGSEAEFRTREDTW